MYLGKLKRNSYSFNLSFTHFLYTILQIEANVQFQASDYLATLAWVRQKKIHFTFLTETPECTRSSLSQTSRLHSPHNAGLHQNGGHRGRRLRHPRGRGFPGSVLGLNLDLIS